MLDSDPVGFYDQVRVDCNERGTIIVFYKWRDLRRIPRSRSEELNIAAAERLMDRLRVAIDQAKEYANRKPVSLIDEFLEDDESNLD